ncbi:MAG: endonuclease/exonuclease/phosphatase family protein [Cyanobacteria bacterium HKST-UBA04]|nr:endonuclease/exonuclease/phosphatase family protein [Cyanobacteria bacterium HKST-UBA04]
MARCDGFSLHGDWHSLLGWVCSLAVHFQFQAAMAALVLAGWFVLEGRHWLAGMAAALVLVNLVPVWPLLTPYTKLPPSLSTLSATQPPLRIMSINIWEYNPRPEAVFKAISANNPDVVVLIEAEDNWKPRLKASPVLARYRYRLQHPDYQMAVYSRYPLSEPRLIKSITHFRRYRPDEAGQAVVSHYSGIRLLIAAVTVTVDGTPLSLVALHPPSPISPGRYDTALNYFNHVAGLKDSLYPNQVVVGDFNTSSQSWFFKRFVAFMNLRDTQRMAGGGWQPSWPTMCPLLYITLDHALMSPAVTLIQRQTGPFTGSDHLPVTVDVALTPKPVPESPAP